MATYIIGDVQGCYRELRDLLREINFGSDDRLWFSGDLVNRGPQSLEVLRFVEDCGARARSVLGNHDLHLLACGLGKRQPHKKDTLDAVLAAADAKAHYDWLRAQALCMDDIEHDLLLVHAGLPPQWTRAEARTHAQEVEQILQSDLCTEFLSAMYGNEPRRWDAALTGMARARCITNALTRLRFCDADGNMDFAEKGELGSQPAHLHAWFAVPARQSRGTRIVFGHWATLHLSPPASGWCAEQGVVGLDTGCVWGGALTAMRAEDGRLFSVRSGFNART